ncbi:MAG: long-chain-acyl-CoA synthetase [Pseudomonadales bacterium]|nr:long-chain-acyl-CoA synthetase [Pseudomonadales bacterium]
MTKQKETRAFTWADIASAGMAILPHIPKLIHTNKKLKQLSEEDTHSIGKQFELLAQTQPNRTFLLFEGKRWSYTEFNAQANKLAHLFKLRGIQRGDCIALMFENRPQLLMCVLAASKLGAVAGMLNHNQQGQVLAHSLQLINPKLVVLGEECLAHFAPQRCVMDSHVPVYIDGNQPKPTGYHCLQWESAGKPTHNLPDTQQVQLKDTCYWVFTSGTTGLPKAAKMTHMRWVKAGLGMGKTAMRLNQNDTLYCPLPFYHNNALTVALSAVLMSGATLALAHKFSRSLFWHEIRAVNATSFIYIGELCRYLLNSPQQPDDKNHAIRVAIGNGMRPEIWDQFQERFHIAHICEFYGASESNLAFVNAFNLKRTAGFCPMNYAIVAFNPETEQPVKNAEGFLQKVKPGETGLLLSEVSANAPFDGYSDTQASQAKLFSNVFESGDRWFNTGDLVMNQGFRHIAFVDRVGDTFRWKGENVATTEVEGAIQRFPEIDDAAVYGVQIPNCDGRAGMAAITLKEGSQFDGKAFLQHLKSLLPTYAIPLFIRIQLRQEVTATFKNKKSDLKKQAFSLSNGGDPVLILRDRNAGYEPLNQSLLNHINNGDLRA